MIEAAKALELCCTMVQGRVDMDTTTTSNAAISACEKGGEWTKALELCCTMVQGRVI